MYRIVGHSNRHSFWRWGPVALYIGLNDGKLGQLSFKIGLDTEPDRALGENGRFLKNVQKIHFSWKTINFFQKIFCPKNSLENFTRGTVIGY